MNNLSTPHLRDLDHATFKAWEVKLQELVQDRRSLEEIGQLIAQNVYDSFKQDVVLARFYATIPLKKLPDEVRGFAAGVAEERGASGLLRDETPVLSLLGTAGDKAEWNSRRRSKGHMGIPLISGDFIESIPMIARLLRDLGVSLTGMDASTSSVETSTFGKLGGLFYVEDASTAVDHSGRKIISAQDFVATHGIKTVFGTAGLYFLTKIFVMMIVFTRDTISRETSRFFMPLGGMVTGSTSALVNRGRLFTS